MKRLPRDRESRQTAPARVEPAAGSIGGKVVATVIFAVVLSAAGAIWWQMGEGGRTREALPDSRRARAEDRELELLTRTLGLDSYPLEAGKQQVGLLVEMARPAEALRMADALVERHPDSAEAYLARSYVRRYAALSDGAITDCERALELDPTSYLWRSCGGNFVLNGTYDRAWPFYALDSGSAFYYLAMAHLQLSMGDTDAALESWSHLAPGHALEFQPRTLRACLAGEFGNDDLQAFVDSSAAFPDGEILYFSSRILALCGALDASLEMVLSAIERNFCSATGLAGERIWDPYRDAPRFLEVQARANECRERFQGSTG